MNRVNISYIGDKPTISQNGIYFNHSKPDKYIYLQATTHILHILDEIEEHHKKSIESFDLSKKFSDSAILDTLYKFSPDFNRYYKKNIDIYERKIKSEEEEVSLNNGLSELEREILENNYHLMFNYRIQRAKNKLAYEEMINGAVKMVKEKKISLVRSIFTREFFHVLQSIKTTIEREKNSPRISLKFIESKDKEMEIELKIEFLKSLKI